VPIYVDGLLGIWVFNTNKVMEILSHGFKGLTIYNPPL
jgi:hypothetical protein